MSTGEPQLDVLLGRGYQHGFVTDIESDTIPPGLDEDVDPRHLAPQGRAAVPARLAPARAGALAHHARAALGEGATIRPSTTRPSPTTRRPRQRPMGPKSLAEVDPKLLATYEKLGVPLHERARLAGVAVDAVFDSVSVATTFKDRLAQGRRDVLSVLRGGAHASGADRAIPGQRRALCATISTRRSTRRCSPTGRSCTSRRACAARWNCPRISASTRPTPGSSSAR